MKFFYAFILLIALLAQNFSRYLVVLQYDLNKNYIAQNFCENRNKPMSCCKGKCYLKKQLAKNDKEEGATNNSKKDRNEVLFFAPVKRSLNFSLIKNDQCKYFDHNSFFIPSDFYGTVFHPPQV